MLDECDTALSLETFGVYEHIKKQLTRLDADYETSEEEPHAVSRQAGAMKTADDNSAVLSSNSVPSGGPQHQEMTNNYRHQNDLSRETSGIQLEETTGDPGCPMSPGGQPPELSSNRYRKLPELMQFELRMAFEKTVLRQRLGLYEDAEFHRLHG
eukprot:GSA25T00005912001.1